MASKPFFRRLIDSKDTSADSLIFVALIAVMGIIFLSGYDVVAQHHEFYPMNFGGGVAAILGGLGGAKMVRDRWSPSGYPAPEPQRFEPYFEPAPRQVWQPGEDSADQSIDNPDAPKRRTR